MTGGLPAAGQFAMLTAALRAAGHRGATVTLPPDIPPHLQRKGSR